MEGLSNKIPNSKIPYVGDYVRIVCSFCNVFRPQVLNPITGWYCWYRSGACTVACSAHVLASMHY